MPRADTRFGPGNDAAVRSGVHSQARIRTVARVHRRRTLRQLGVRASELDPIGKTYVDQVVRLRSKIDLIDAYVSESGLIKPDGSPQGVLAFYVSLENSLRLAVGKLESHFQVADRHPVSALAEAGRAVRLARRDDDIDIDVE